VRLSLIEDSVDSKRRGRFHPTAGVACGLLACLLLSAGRSDAAQIDVSLNLFYNNTANATLGGTWQIAAKTDEFGLAGINLLLQNISVAPGTVTLLAPTGQVNGSEAAGFFSVTAALADRISVTIGQAPSRDGIGTDTVFYGVGSIDDPDGGAPNYPDQLVDFPNTTSIGPSLPTLTNLNNVPWGTTDPLNDPAWDSAALLLTGTFAPGMIPSFFSNESDQSAGSVFTSTGTTTVAGNASDFESTILTTIVRGNLDLIDGDYNGDGTVSAADYTVWRDSLSLAVPIGTGADGNENGIIDAGDYTIWKSNFGNSAGAGFGTFVSGPVPEPQTAILAGLAAMGLAFFRQLRSQ